VNYRAPLSEIISDTVEQWDAELAARRIELHIGRDLQFIRIVPRLGKVGFVGAPNRGAEAAPTRRGRGRGSNFSRDCRRRSPAP
jgi:hypothetical protein